MTSTDDSNSMEQSPSRWPHSCSADQETPCNLWDQGFITELTISSLRALSRVKMNQVHNLMPCFIKVNFKIKSKLPPADAP
jgi:hypothetical protein